MVSNQAAVSATPTGQMLDLDKEREKIHQEYEAKLAQLTMQYTAEQQTSAQLQDELKKTRENYEQQLAALNSLTSSSVTPQVKTLAVNNILTVHIQICSLIR